MSRNRKFDDQGFPPDVDFIGDSEPVMRNRMSQQRHEEGYAGTRAMVERDPRDDHDKPIPLTKLFY